MLSGHDLKWVFHHGHFLRLQWTSLLISRPHSKVGECTFDDLQFNNNSPSFGFNYVCVPFFLTLKMFTGDAYSIKPMHRLEKLMYPPFNFINTHKKNQVSSFPNYKIPSQSSSATSETLLWSFIQFSVTVLSTFAKLETKPQKQREMRWATTSTLEEPLPPS